MTECGKRSIDWGRPCYLPVDHSHLHRDCSGYRWLTGSMRDDAIAKLVSRETARQKALIWHHLTHGQGNGSRYPWELAAHPDIASLLDALEGVASEGQAP